MAKRITQTIQREIVDVTTGELVKIDTLKTFTEKINPDRFYMTFLDYVQPVHQITSDLTRHILDWMCENAEFNTGRIIIAPAIRDKMCEELKTTTAQISRALKSLKDLKLITGERGTYFINPEIFWKGNLQSRKQALEGKSLKVSFELVEDEN